MGFPTLALQLDSPHGRLFSAAGDGALNCEHMHLRHLSIENYRAIKRREISFLDALGEVRPITVLAGPNGCGKSSILLAITNALRGALRLRLPDINQPSDEDLHRADPSGRLPVTASVSIELQYGREEMSAIRRVFDATRRLRADGAALNPPALPDGRMKTRWQWPPRTNWDGTVAPAYELQTDVPHGAVWLNGPSAAWRGLRSRYIQSVTEIEAVGMLSLFTQSRDRRWGVDADYSEDGAGDRPRSALAGEAQPVDREPPTVQEVLRRLSEWSFGLGLDAGDPRKQWEARLQERFAKICHPKRYLGFWQDHPRYGPTPLLCDGESEYPFSLAASGELVILHYLTKFCYPRPIANSLVLIDEPELHLHPAWIRQLYRALPQFGTNNQFILVTHSAEIRQLAADDGALIELGRLDD
jgi:energy-coupling factor transporter ATP-binding protein EcfA2